MECTLGSALPDVCLSSCCGWGCLLNTSIALPQNLEQVLPFSGLIMIGCPWKVLGNGFVYQALHKQLVFFLEVFYLVASPVVSPFLASSFFFVLIFLMFTYFWERERERETETERESVSRGGAEREGNRIWSRLQAVSTEPDAGLELTSSEIVTWTGVGRLTHRATWTPQLLLGKALLSPPFSAPRAKPGT